MDIRFAYIPCKDSKEAKEIGRVLVEEKLAACSNIIDSMSSIYKWEGELKEESEALLIAKTKSSLIKKLTARVQELHSYDTPCIATFAPADLNPGYLQWLESQTL